MQQIVFKTSTGRILRCLSGIWITLVIQILLNIFLVPIIVEDNNYWSIIVLNLAYDLFLFVPSLSIIMNYLEYSRNKELIITEKSIVLKDTKDLTFIEIPISEINFIDEYTTLDLRLHRDNPGFWPWNNFEYFVFKRYGGKDNIIVPFFIVDLIKILEILDKRIKKRRYRLQHFYKRFPTIEPNKKLEPNI